MAKAKMNQKLVERRASVLASRALDNAERLTRRNQVAASSMLAEIAEKQAVLHKHAETVQAVDREAGERAAREMAAIRAVLEHTADFVTKEHAKAVRKATDAAIARISASEAEIAGFFGHVEIPKLQAVDGHIGEQMGALAEIAKRAEEERDDAVRDATELAGTVAQLRLATRSDFKAALAGEPSKLLLSLIAEVGIARAVIMSLQGTSPASADAVAWLSAWHPFVVEQIAEMGASGELVPTMRDAVSPRLSPARAGQIAESWTSRVTELAQQEQKVKAPALVVHVDDVATDMVTQPMPEPQPKAKAKRAPKAKA